MNVRLATAAAAAVLLASCSEFQVTLGLAWLVLAAATVGFVALAGMLTRLAPFPAAAGATALAALALAPTIAAPHTWIRLAGLLGVAACAASARAIRPLPLLASAVSYLAAPFLFLNATLAGRESFVRLVPTISSVGHLMTLARQAASLTADVPPVPDTPGLRLVLACGIALVAIAVDVIAVRHRRPALAGLPLLVLFLAPAATAAKLGGVAGTVEFLIATAGYLSLLSADGRSRVRGWGRLVTVWQQPVDDRDSAEIGKLAATGRRVGLAAVAVAVIAPLVLPAARLLRTSGPGHSTIVEVTLPDPVVQLSGLLTSQAIRPVLSYRTGAAQPEGQYLQVYLLNYDQASDSWRMIVPGRGVAVGSDPLPAPAEIVPGTPQIAVSSTITLDQVTGFAWPVHFLPVPYWPLSLRIQGSWREDLATQMIYSGVTPLSQLRYTVTSSEPDPSPSSLSGSPTIPAQVAREYLGYAAPAGVTAQLRALAARIINGQGSGYARAVALEHWFLAPGRFVYTLRPNLPNTPAGLLGFLTTSRRGYCQQFAFAFAVLARLLGIPSRIAVGYTGGQRQSDGGWLVTTADAHAWPELYFAGAGWLRFEPTPGGATGQGTAVPPPYATAPLLPAGPGANLTAPTAPFPAPSRDLPGARNQRLRGPGSAGPVPASQTGLPPTAWIAIAGGIAGIGLIASLPGLIRARTRRKRWRAAARSGRLAAAAWQEISDSLLDFGLRHLPSDTPRVVARTILAASHAEPAEREAVARITSAVEQAFYGPGDDAPAPGIIRDDVASVRAALTRSATRTTRLRTRLLPASTMRPARSALRFVTGLASEPPEPTGPLTRQERDVPPDPGIMAGSAAAGSAAAGRAAFR